MVWPSPLHSVWRPLSNRQPRRHAKQQPGIHIAGISLSSRQQIATLGQTRSAHPLGLAEDDELEGAVVVAVLLSPDGRVMPQRRTMAGGG
jgi:hypothetical protein